MIPHDSNSMTHQKISDNSYELDGISTKMMGELYPATIKTYAGSVGFSLLSLQLRQASLTGVIDGVGAIMKCRDTNATISKGTQDSTYRKSPRRT